MTGAGHASPDPRRYGYVVGKVRRTDVRLDLDQAGTDLVYPSVGGIPLPTWAVSTAKGDTSYGMHRNLTYIIMRGEGFNNTVHANEVLWKYEPSGHAIRGFMGQYTTAGPGGATELKELPTTWKVTVLPNTLSFYFEAVGW